MIVTGTMITTEESDGVLVERCLIGPTTVLFAPRAWSSSSFSIPAPSRPLSGSTEVCVLR